MELDIAAKEADQYAEAHTMVCSIVNAFDGRSRRSVLAGAIGSLGCDVFSALARQHSAFLRPAPFRRDTLCRTVICSRGSLAKALARLVEHGFLTLSGTRIAPMAMLHLPAGAVDAFQQEEGEWTAQAKVFGIDNPLSQMDLDTAFKLLDRGWQIEQGQGSRSGPIGGANQQRRRHDDGQALESDREQPLSQR